MRIDSLFRFNMQFNRNGGNLHNEGDQNDFTIGQKPTIRSYIEHTIQENRALRVKVVELEKQLAMQQEIIENLTNSNSHVQNDNSAPATE